MIPSRLRNRADDAAFDSLGRRLAIASLRHLGSFVQALGIAVLACSPLIATLLLLTLGYAEIRASFTSSDRTTSVPQPVLIEGAVGDTLAATGLLDRNQQGELSIDIDAVAALLEQIDTAAAPTEVEYDRDTFGQRWADVDRNGCDQRNDVLARDLVDETVDPGTQDCVVRTGTLADPYTGTTIAFRRGETTSTAVQIDHLIPLAYAHRNGASGWTPAQRETFANDLDNLQAVDGPTNASKSDQGPAEWMPPADSYRCTYVTRFVFVAHRYQVAIPAEDRAAIADLLPTCR